MPNPHRWRNIGLGFFASGLIATVAAFLLPDAVMNDTIRAALFIYGSTAILFGAARALFRRFYAGANEAIAGGEEIVARRFGWVLLTLGIFVSALMGVVLYATSPVLLHPVAGGSRFSGTPQQAKLVLGLLGAVELFGITATCYGLFQIVTGRRNKWIIYFLIGIALLLGLIALLMPHGGS